MSDPFSGTLFCVAVTPAKLREHHDEHHVADRFLVVLGRGAGKEITEQLPLMIDSNDQIRDLIAIASPGYVDVLVGENEDHDAMLASLLRPRPPGSLIDFDAMRREADRAIEIMMKNGGGNHGNK